LGGNVRFKKFAHDFRLVFGSDLLWVLVRVDVYADFGSGGILTGEVLVSTRFLFVHGGGLGEVANGKAWITVELDDKLGGQGRAVEKFKVVWANVSIDIKIIKKLFERVSCEFRTVVRFDFENGLIDIGVPKAGGAVEGGGCGRVAVGGLNLHEVEQGAKVRRYQLC